MEREGVIVENQPDIVNFHKTLDHGHAQNIKVVDAKGTTRLLAERGYPCAIMRPPLNRLSQFR
jgi:hypothetical protein